MFVQRKLVELNLFGLEPGISMQNVPQSRNAAEADAVAEPSPPSTPAPPSQFQWFSGGRFTAGTFKKSKKDKKSKKAEKPKKIKNAATYTGSGSMNKSRIGQRYKRQGIGCMNVIVVPDAAMDGGQRIELAVDSTDTISDVKQQIFRHLRWETNLRLTFAGKYLADDKTLAFCNITDGSTLTYRSRAAVVAKLARLRVTKNRSTKRIDWRANGC
jgi:hypothetical protein